MAEDGKGMRKQRSCKYSRAEGGRQDFRTRFLNYSACLTFGAR